MKQRAQFQIKFRQILTHFVDCLILTEYVIRVVFIFGTCGKLVVVTAK